MQFNNGSQLREKRTDNEPTRQGPFLSRGTESHDAIFSSLSILFEGRYRNVWLFYIRCVKNPIISRRKHPFVHWKPGREQPWLFSRPLQLRFHQYRFLWRKISLHTFKRHSESSFVEYGCYNCRVAWTFLAAMRWGSESWILVPVGTLVGTLVRGYCIIVINVTRARLVQREICAISSNLIVPKKW